MVIVGIRQLKDQLCTYVHEVQAGERVFVTKRGRVVAELVPSGVVSNAGGATPAHERASAPAYDPVVTIPGIPWIEL
jgi:prevent-host-death family protein